MNCLRTGAVASWLALLAVSGCGTLVGATKSEGHVAAVVAAIDPAHATYVVENRPIALSGGKALIPAAPGSAERVETSLFGMPAWGDLDSDGDDDAAVILVHRTGGSGSFYYVAAALREGEGFKGTNAVLLGDRIAPQTLQIRNGVLIANFAERGPGEAMTAAPRSARSRYLTLQAGQLLGAEPFAAGMQVLEGWVTIGHETRSFHPCGQRESVWLDPASGGFEAIRNAYDAALAVGALPYTPVFMSLAGRLADAPEDGFGRDYGASFRNARLVQAWPRGNCRAEEIRVTAPAPGSVAGSPLRVIGMARDAWFSAGEFPLELRNDKGRILASGFATARGTPTSEGFLAFEGVLTFKAESQPLRGSLVLFKGKPAGERSLHDTLELPVFYRGGPADAPVPR